MDRQVLFIHTKKEVLAYVLAQNPRLTISWPPKSRDFKIDLTAYNPATVSEGYSLQFNVIDVDETEIQPTDQFDKEAVSKLGKVKSPKENTTFSADISIN